MKNRKIRRIGIGIGIVLYSIWATLFYQLTFTGWTLEYSYYGVAMVVGLSLLFMYAFPKRDRRVVVRFTLYAVILSLGIANFAPAAGMWRIVDTIVFIILAIGLGRWLVPVRMGWQLLTLVSLLLFEMWIPLSDVNLLTAFNVNYVGHRSSQDAQVPSIPVTVIPNSRGLQTMITIRGHRPVPHEAQTLIDAMATSGNPTLTKDAIIQLQHSYDLISIKPGKVFFHTSLATPQQLARTNVDSLAMIDFPFSQPHFLSVEGNVRMYVTLAKDPGYYTSMLLNPGTLSTAVGQMALQTAATTQEEWKAIGGNTQNSVQGLSLQNGYLSGSYQGHPIHVKTVGVTILGIKPLLPSHISTEPQAVVEGDNVIQVISLGARPHVIATLNGSYLHPLTTDLVFADVTGNGSDAMLINTVPAQIVQLTPSGTWKTLWVSGRSTFRFEAVLPRAGGDLIIANSPSLISQNPIRYLGGYVYQNGTLNTVFRSYHGNLVDLHVVHILNGPPQILTSVYAHQEIILLSQSKIPWYPVVLVVYGFVVLAGLVRRTRGVKA